MYYQKEKCIKNPEDITNIINQYVLKDVSIVKTNKKIEYYNCPASFDTEFTSFYEQGEKRSIMYAWTFGINGVVVLGRTWNEFLEMYKKIVELLSLHKDKRLIVYCHNLGIEFQEMRHLLQWEKVFSIDVRKPLYALTTCGVEFRCSYLLTGYSLAKVGENLIKYPCKKLVGDLDYQKKRHTKTPLTEKEKQYCANDVIVVMNCIQEKIEREGNITKIPLTNTGYVRNFCRKSCLYCAGKYEKSKKYNAYHRIMKELTLTPDEYRQAKRAFAGGFTHANAFRQGRVYYKVGSFDFTSSYTATMIAEQFPMGRGELIQIKSEDEFYKNMRLYCCMFDIEIYGVQAICFSDHPLSSSKCGRLKKPVVDNGRIVSADYLITTVTEQDFYIFSKFYTWNKIVIHNFRRYKKGYLPTDFVKAILQLYKDKTELKDVEGKEVEYMHSKGMLNACYGMAVTDICRDEIEYTDDWQPAKKADISKEIEKYNKNKRRFLFYLWGVWVTAYARRNLFSGIYEFGKTGDYIYSDTDSIKAINAERHMDYINRYNADICKKLERALKYHNIPIEMYRPKTIEGIEKPLGVWDFEGTYTRFKTLGAKRYITEKEKNGKLVLSLTVSGVNKKYAIPYLQTIYGSNTAIFNAFNDQMYIPKGQTGKNIHTYIDTPVSGVMTDYLGNTAEYYETSGVHLESCDYTLSIAIQYADYLKGIRSYDN